jgi:LysE type translocator
MDQVSIYLPGIILAYSVFLLAIMSPGPNVLAVIGTSMSVGRNAGIALALGVAAGSFGWAFLAAVGLSALLASYAHALTAIKIAGGVYLLWLAYKAFRSAASAHDIEVAELSGSNRTLGGYFARGFAIQMTNPKGAGLDRDHIARASGKRAALGRVLDRAGNLDSLGRDPLPVCCRFLDGGDGPVLFQGAPMDPGCTRRMLRLFRLEVADEPSLERDDFSSGRHPALPLCSSMIFSKNR